MIDAKEYDMYHQASMLKYGKYEYSILLLVHALEKGFCSNNIKQFGKEKCIELISILKKYKTFQLF